MLASRRDVIEDGQAANLEVRGIDRFHTTSTGDPSYSVKLETAALTTPGRRPERWAEAAHAGFFQQRRLDPSVDMDTVLPRSEPTPRV